jgi:hypothetical protein
MLGDFRFTGVQIYAKFYLKLGERDAAAHCKFRT